MLSPRRFAASVLGTLLALAASSAGAAAPDEDRRTLDFLAADCLEADPAPAPGDPFEPRIVREAGAPAGVMLTLPAYELVAARLDECDAIEASCSAPVPDPDRWQRLALPSWGVAALCVAVGVLGWGVEESGVAAVGAGCAIGAGAFGAGAWAAGAAKP